MERTILRAVVAAGLLLAAGISAAAYIHGSLLRHIGGSRQVITVKGLAEKSVKADLAEWTIGVDVTAPTVAQAVSALRRERPLLDRFLASQGFAGASLREGGLTVQPNMVAEPLPDGRVRQVQKGFAAAQDVTVVSRELGRVAAAEKAALELKVQERPIHYGAPLYLVSGLEEVKMSLIGAATRNARVRAEEFARNGNARVGSMRSASQGAFYILAPGTREDANDYGGIYDKSTVDKTARVVVTIEYGIEP